MRTITREEALHALNMAVASKGPNYVDKDAAAGLICRNVVKAEDGTWVPSCIVGTALVYLGVPPEWFEMARCTSVSIATVAIRLVERDLLNIEEAAIELMVEAQTAQDNKQTWGDAVARAYLGWLTFSELKPRDEA